MEGACLFGTVSGLQVRGDGVLEQLDAQPELLEFQFLIRSWPQEESPRPGSFWMLLIDAETEALAHLVGVIAPRPDHTGRSGFLGAACIWDPEQESSPQERLHEAFTLFEQADAEPRGRWSAWLKAYGATKARGRMWRRARSQGQPLLLHRGKALGKSEALEGEAEILAQIAWLDSAENGLAVILPAPTSSTIMADWRLLRECRQMKRRELFDVTKRNKKLEQEAVRNRKHLEAYEAKLEELKEQLDAAKRWPNELTRHDDRMRMERIQRNQAHPSARSGHTPPPPPTDHYSSSKRRESMWEYMLFAGLYILGHLFILLAFVILYRG